MSTEDTMPSPQTYRIGAVSRLTGVPTDTLRVWERRYGVVTPIRSPSGTRLYRPEDVGRLSLIKQLVDRGDAISSVAGLSMDQLRERARGAVLSATEDVKQRPCRMVVLGPTLPRRLKDEDREQEGLELVGLFEDRGDFAAQAAALSPDVLLLEYPTIHSEQVREVAELLAQSGAARAVVIYNFATRTTIERLDARRIVPRRAPIDFAELRRLCVLAPMASQGPIERPPAETGIDLGRPIPPRRFDDAKLARVASLSPTVRCECPHHLVDLITHLTAFERYSEECEIRNVDDAALHAFLHVATAQARYLMETALARVLEAEGVDVTAG